MTTNEEIDKRFWAKVHKTKLKIKGVLAYAVMEQNDGYEGDLKNISGEDRYKSVLKWVREQLATAQKDA